MSDDIRWCRIEEMFLAAVEFTDPAERNRFLDEAAGGDSELRAEVEALLAADEAVNAEGDCFIPAGGLPVAALFQHEGDSTVADSSETVGATTVHDVTEAAQVAHRRYVRCPRCRRPVTAGTAPDLLAELTCRFCQHSFNQLGRSSTEGISALAREFADQWHSSSPDVFDFLDQHSRATPAELQEVLLIDQHQRWQQGNPMPAETYLERCPAVAADRELRLELIRNEFRHHVDSFQENEEHTLLQRFPELATELLETLTNGESEAEVDSRGFSIRPQGQTSGGEADSRFQFGDYEVIERIAAGGMGVVYRARQTSLNRIVALKLIRSGELATEDQKRRFRMEAEAAGRLDHPGIVPVYEAGQHDGEYFLSMALVDGRRLDEQLAAGQSDPWHVARLMEQVADAVQFAHDQGVIHRDLKPANILVDSQGVPRITDFGLARNLLDQSRLTITGQILGTPAYMSPEQAQASEVGRPADIYALGATLYSLLTGRPPFQSSDTARMLRQVIERDPVPPNQLNPAIGDDLAAICMKCLEKQPDDRYPSAAAVAADLRSYCAGLPVQARPVSPEELIRRSWTRRGYNILETLRTSRQSTTYLADGTSLNRVVRLKVFRSEAAPAGAEVRSADSPARQAQDGFFHRAASAAQFSHPNSVPVFEAGEHEGDFFVSSAFMEGVTLQQVIAQAPLSPRRAASIVRQAAQAIAAAHAAGIHHGDLEPAGIVLDEADTPQILELGYSDRVLGAATPGRYQAIVSVSGYLAPEQLQEPPCVPSAEADVYALGATLYAALTGRPPFQSSSPRETRTQILQSVPVSPVELNPAVPGDLATICLSCLRKVPAQRLPSAEALVAELQRFLNGEPILSRPVGWLERGWMWCRRRPAVASLLLLASVLGLVLAIGGPLAAVRQSQLRRDAEDQRLQAERQRHLAEEQRSLAWQQRRAAVEEKKRAEALLYAAQIASAQQHFENHNLEAMRASLNECRLDLRGWEHNFLSTLLATGPQTLRGHDDLVREVCCTSDGTQFISCSNDRTVRIWDVATRKCLRTLSAHREIVRCVALSPDDRLILSGSDDCTVRVWERASRSLLRTLKGHTAPVLCVRCSPRGDLVISGSEDCTLRCWDLKTGELLQTLQTAPHPVGCVAFHPAGRRFVSGGSDGTLRIWSRSLSTPLHTRKDHKGAVTCVACSPDGSLLASGGEDGVLILREGRSGIPKFRLTGHAGPIRSVAFSPDGSRIVSGSNDHTLRIWDTALGQPAITLAGHSNIVTSVLFSPDGGHIVSGSFDHSIRIWNGSQHQDPVVVAAHDHEIGCVDYSPDGRHIATASHDLTVKVWDLQTCQSELLLDGHQAAVTAVQYSPNGRWLATSDFEGTINLWNAVSGQSAWTQAYEGQRIHSVAFTPDGELVAGAMSNGTIRLWRASTGVSVGVLSGHDMAVTCICVAADGRRLFSGSEDHTIRQWNLSTRSEITQLRGHRAAVMSLALSPDGRLLASGGDNGTIRLWDLGSGNLSSSAIHRAHQRAVLGLSFNQAATRLVSAGSDHAICIWDVATAQKTLTLNEHRGPVKCVQFSPDGRQFASAGDDQKLRLWTASRWLTDPERPLERDSDSATRSD